MQRQVQVLCRHADVEAAGIAKYNNGGSTNGCGNNNGNTKS
jgi:hypothetical protein